MIGSLYAKCYSDTDHWIAIEPTSRLAGSSMAPKYVIKNPDTGPNLLFHLKRRHLRR